MDSMGLSTKADILVFFANAIDTKGEDGSQIRGCTIHYVFLNNMYVAQSEYDITKPVGMQRGKSWVDYQMRDKVRIAPAIYEGSFEMSVGGDGKPSLKLVDIAYKSHVQFVPCILPGLDLPGMVPCDAPSFSDVMAAIDVLKKSAASGNAEKPAEPDSKSGNAEKPAEPDSKSGKKAV